MQKLSAAECRRKKRKVTVQATVPNQPHLRPDLSLFGGARAVVLLSDAALS